ncbi:BolA/IbaG family iron-sulfur metabolism protein [Buchnera aphidicola]|uniref:Transcriptional activator of morphogenic pathway n=1 Tax=Buchnera aphidicola subsp. Cinara cedri (strain Cc) TaxID=372461 RepID=Q057E7_BUCCC|nr:BolA family protein [Buchnera aphidicola]ABJ90752.1 transcriptional activator of morphogenic pathway [Buchnera aphidicola BCc]
MKKKIKKKIKSIFDIFYLKISKVTHFNKNYRKNSKHYMIIISAYEFNKLSLLEQHKKIYKIFFKYIPKKIYSIQIQTFTVFQWKEKKKKIFLPVSCINS